MSKYSSLPTILLDWVVSTIYIPMCAYYSRQRAVGMFNFYNRQLLSRCIEQQVGYYAVDTQRTEVDTLYGESDAKFFLDPVIIDCLVTYTEQQADARVKLPDTGRTITVSFWKQFLIDLDVVPMKGDFIFWNDDYFEITSVIESMYFTGKVPEFSMSESTDQFGGSLSVVVDCVYVNREKLGID